ncbi:MAG: hypothetical protein ABI585_17125 [Betaproteobacteria bacterium]
MLGDILTDEQEGFGASDAGSNLSYRQRERRISQHEFPGADRSEVDDEGLVVPGRLQGRGRQAIGAGVEPASGGVPSQLTIHKNNDESIQSSQPNPLLGLQAHPIGQRRRTGRDYEQIVRTFQVRVQRFTEFVGLGERGLIPEHVHRAQPVERLRQPVQRMLDGLCHGAIALVALRVRDECVMTGFAQTTSPP